MTDKQIIEEDMVNAENFCPYYPCQVDCYEARICPFFVETLQQLQAKEQEYEELKTEFDKFEEQFKLQGNFIDSFLFATKNSDWLNKSILEDEADAIIEKVESDYVQLENYKQALQEIKNFIYIEKAKVFVDMEDFWEQILQKCEVIKDEH